MQNFHYAIALTTIAGLSTVIGSLIVLTIKNFNNRSLSYFLGLSAGSMIYISFVELLPESINKIGFAHANLVFFLGILLVGILDLFIPHHINSYCERKGIAPNKQLLSGIMIAISLAIHNFPEGIVVFMSSLGNLKIGIMIAIATIIHNIPEGVAIAAPIYHATKSKTKAILTASAAGIAEPIGAIVCFLILSHYITDNLISYIFAFVAGIMVYISLDELLPSCFENCTNHTAISGIVSGMIVMAFSLGIS